MRKLFSDGCEARVVPLSFGRARIVVGLHLDDPLWYSELDAW